MIKCHIVILFWAFIPVSCTHTGSRQDARKQTFNENWKFALSDAQDAYQTPFDDSSWQTNVNN